MPSKHGFTSAELAAFKQNARWARENITSPRRLPGSRSFRKDWHQFGPDDVEFAVDAYRVNSKELADKRRERDTELKKAETLEGLMTEPRVEETQLRTTLPSQAASEVETLREELRELRRALQEHNGARDQQRAEHEEALKPLQDEIGELEVQQEHLSAQLGEQERTRDERRKKVAKFRKELETIQQAVNLLHPLLEAVKRRYDIKDADGTDG